MTPIMKAELDLCCELLYEARRNWETKAVLLYVLEEQKARINSSSSQGWCKLLFSVFYMCKLLNFTYQVKGEGDLATVLNLLTLNLTEV